MINDSRARRLTKEFNCDKCKFKSGSETLFKRHKEKVHSPNKIISNIKTYIPKRLNCEHCTQKFNKTTTFQKHMKTVHQDIKEIASDQKQNDLPNQVDEVHSRVTRLRNNKIIESPWNPNN